MRPRDMLPQRGDSRKAIITKVLSYVLAALAAYFGAGTLDAATPGPGPSFLIPHDHTSLAKGGVLDLTTLEDIESGSLSSVNVQKATTFTVTPAGSEARSNVGWTSLVLSELPGDGGDTCEGVALYGAPFDGETAHELLAVRARQHEHLAGVARALDAAERVEEPLLLLHPRGTPGHLRRGELREAQRLAVARPGPGEAIEARVTRDRAVGSEREPGRPVADDGPAGDALDSERAGELAARRGVGRGAAGERQEKHGEGEQQQHGSVGHGTGSDRGDAMGPEPSRQCPPRIAVARAIMGRRRFTAAPDQGAS